MVTRWLHACGERPYRCFIRAWVVLALASVAIGFVGTTVQTWPPRPPAAGTIPYADFMRGAPHVTRMEQPGLDLDPDTLPPFAGIDRRYWFRIVADGGAPHLHSGCTWRIGTYGWPVTSVVTSTQTTWDVSDPAAPGAPVAGAYRTDFFGHASQMGVSWTSERGATAHNVSFMLPGGLMHVAAPQALALLAVLPAATWRRARRRRRCRRGACVACGHALDPARTGVPCPECGAAPGTDRPPSRAPGREPGRAPGRMVTALFLVFVTAWTVVQIAVTTDHPLTPHDERLAGMARAGDELQQSFTQRVTLLVRNYGWPTGVFVVQEDLWYAIAPGLAPQPATPRDAAGWTARSNRINRTRHHDLSASTIWSINWTTIVLHVAVMHIVATMLAGLWFSRAGSVAGRRRRTAAAR